MTMKKIEELDYYELLNIKPNASREDIETAYLYGIASFHPDSIASYGLISDGEKKIALTRLEEAYKTLSNAEKRRKYDLKLHDMKDQYQEKAYFRKTTSRLEIEDGEKIKKSFKEKLKKRFASSRKNKNPEAEELKRIQEAKESFQNNHVFYSGEYLKKVREARGLSLEEIAYKSKLNVSLLKALEEENYDVLPKGVYTPHLIKLYAQHLGLNPREQD